MNILAEHARQTERQGRPAAESLEAVRRAGDFALRVPVEHGGAGADASTVALRLAELGRFCPSTSWIVGTSAVSKTLVARAPSALLPKEYTEDPDAMACGSGVPSGQVDRGVLTGSWKSISGCEDAAWAVLPTMDGEQIVLALVPTSDLKIEHTWDMTGMQGTGSHTLVADGLPVTHILPFTLPYTPSEILFFGLTAVAPMVGATRGALDLIQDMFASDRKPYLTNYTRMAESPGARHWLGEATRLVNRAERTMLAVAAVVDPDDVPGLSVELVGAAQDCRAALELMLDLHGTSGFAHSNALQRFWRDVAVGSRHPLLNAYLTAERYGEAVSS